MLETITNTNGADNASCPNCGHYNAMLGGWGDKEPATCRDCGHQAYVVEPEPTAIGAEAFGKVFEMARNAAVAPVEAAKPDAVQEYRDHLKGSIQCSRDVLQGLRENPLKTELARLRREVSLLGDLAGSLSLLVTSLEGANQ